MNSQIKIIFYCITLFAGTLSSEEGIKEVNVSLENKIIEINFLCSKWEPESISRRICEMGFHATVSSANGKQVASSEYTLFECLYFKTRKRKKIKRKIQLICVILKRFPV